MSEYCSCGREICTKRIPLFSSLPEKKQIRLVGKAIHTERERGEFLISEGERVNSIFIIREGRVKINRYDEEGKEYILDIRTDGDTVCEELFFSAEEADYNAVCLTTVKICEIRKEYVSELIREEPDIAWNMIRTLSQRLDHSNEMLEILQENDAMARVVKFLLVRSRRIPDDEITLTIDDIAAAVNLRKETVSRKLSMLQDEHLIRRLGQRRIRLIDISGLKNMLKSPES